MSSFCFNPEGAKANPVIWITKQLGQLRLSKNWSYQRLIQGKNYPNHPHRTLYLNRNTAIFHRDVGKKEILEGSALKKLSFPHFLSLVYFITKITSWFFLFDSAFCFFAHLYFSQVLLTKVKNEWFTNKTLKC